MEKTKRVSNLYREISPKLGEMELTTRLLIISNLLFDCYKDARKADQLYNEIDKPELEVIEDYAFMKELYSFNEDSFVFITLDRAHDLLRLSIELDKLKYGTKDAN